MELIVVQSALSHSSPALTLSAERKRNLTPESVILSAQPSATTGICLSLDSAQPSNDYMSTF